MPRTDRFGDGERGDSGSPPRQQKGGVPSVPIVLVLLVPLLLIAAGIGVFALMWGQTEDGPAGGSTQESDSFKLDLATVAQELADDRAGTKSKYLGRMIEFEVTNITIESRDQTQVVLLLPVMDKGSPASSFGLEFKGRFPFANPRNSMLKEANSGPLRVRVRGALARIDHLEAADTVYTFVLDPAWVGRID